MTPSAEPRPYGYDYATSQRGTQTAQQHYEATRTSSPSVGGETQILQVHRQSDRYLTLTALYGQSNTPSSSNNYDV